MLMRYCHRQLESKLPDKKFKKILEIGAGSEPHFSYIKNKDFTYFILEKTKHIQQNTLRKITIFQIYPKRVRIDIRLI